jgi:hypothetical protein
MNEINQAARSRQRARLAEGEKPAAPRAAPALAKSKTCQSAADAPETLRAYKADFYNFSAWCAIHGFQPLPAEPETVGLISRPPDWAMRCRRCGAGLPRLRVHTGWPSNRSTRAIRRSARPCAALVRIAGQSVQVVRLNPPEDEHFAPGSPVTIRLPLHGMQILA